MIFCILTCICWGLSTYTVNWKAYIDSKRDVKENQSLAVSLMLNAMGTSMFTVISLVICPQIPFKWVKLKEACWSVATGVLYAIAMIFYMLAANAGAPASIIAPVTGLSIVVPIIWYILFYQKCISRNILLGFICSITCLFLYSGVVTIKSSADSEAISTRE